MSDVKIFSLKIEQPKGWRCPKCGGCGHLSDGMFSFGTNAETGEIVHQSRPATKCYVCNGKGRVKVLPLDD